MRKDLTVLVPLMKTLTLYFARVCLHCSLKPLMYGMTSSKLSSLSIRGRISKLGQHLYILQTSHTHSDPTTEYIQCFMVLCEIRGILPVPLIVVYGHVIMHVQCTAAK